MDPKQIALLLTENVSINNGLILEQHGMRELTKVINKLKAQGNLYLQKLFPNDQIDFNNPDLLKLHQAVLVKYNSLGIFPKRAFQHDTSLERLEDIVLEVIKKQAQIPTPSGPERTGGKWTDRSFAGP
jgi:hypothetical protein